MDSGDCGDERAMYDGPLVVVRVDPRAKVGLPGTLSPEMLRLKVGVPTLRPEMLRRK